MAPHPDEDPESRPLAGSAGGRQHHRESSGGPVPGASLLLAARHHDPEGPLSERSVATLAAEVGLEPAEFEKVTEFLRRTLDAQGSEPLLLCAGMACGLAGAAKFVPELVTLLRHRGIRRPVRSVHCLEHCNSGPNVALSRQIYCGGLQRVLTDPRLWRDPPGTGTVVVDGGGSFEPGQVPASGDSPES